MKYKSQILWGCFVLLLLAFPLFYWQHHHKSSVPLAELGSVPDFSLLDQEGQVFEAKSLLGKITVANFIFTSCAETCPRLTEKMQEVEHFLVQEELPQVQLLSFSVDPERDTRERLAEYAQAHDIPYPRWKLLTGTLGEMEEIVIKGFRQAMGKAAGSENPGLFEIMHGNRFVLIDPLGKIRGYFQVAPEEEGMLSEMPQLQDAIIALAAASGPALTRK